MNITCSNRSLQKGIMIQRLISKSFTPPWVLAGVVLLAYGIMIPRLGLYGDDWIYIYNYQLLGANSFRDFVAVDRPFSAWVYQLVTPWFGTSVFPYHLLMLVLRWVSAVLVWSIIRVLWPLMEGAALAIALLFAVYPGFQQQPIAVQFILHFIVLNLFLCSILLMLKAVERVGRYWQYTIIGVFCALSIFSLEYFVGLELLRPALLWIIFSRLYTPQSAGNRWVHVFRHWSPYLAITALFVAWRVFFFQFPTYQPVLIDNLLESPHDALIALFSRIVLDLKIAMIDAWRMALKIPGEKGLLPSFLVVVIVSSFLAWTGLRKVNFSKTQEGTMERHLNTQYARAITLAIFSLLCAGIPFWFTFIRVELAFPWDRSLLPFMLGASACVVFINLLVVQPRFQIALVAILAALSSGLHYQNAQTYRVENERLNNYFWQMAWRVPGLEPGTTIVSDDIPLYRYSDNDITPIVNWTYAPDLKGNRLLYKYFDLSTRESSPLPGFSDGLRFGHSYRNHQFQGSTSQVLAIYYDLSHCLWLLSPEDQVVPDLPPSLYDVLPISRPDLVLVDVQPTANPPKQLGKEPEHGWCYAYEKAELSRQAGDWETIATLGDQAWESGLEPGHPIEYLPFIQGYANIGNMEQVHRLMEIVLQDAELKPSLCSRLQIDSVQKSKNINQEIERMRKEIGCKL